MSKQKAEWEELAELDPFWAVLSRADAQFGKWDLTQFLETGRQEIDRMMAIATRLGHPQDRQRALDFGCGPGRLTRALAAHFDEAVGVDISDPMIRRARELHSECRGCRFIVTSRADLSLFPRDHFDMVFSDIVLQHIPDRKQISTYIREFLRIVRPGGLVIFQLLSFIPLRYRLQPRRRLYSLMRSLGISHRFLYEKLRLTPIRNNFMAEPDVVHELEASGAKVLDVRRNTIEGSGIRNCWYFATRPA